MDPISLIVLVVVVGAVSIWLDRRWQSRKTSQPPMSESAAKEKAGSSILAKTTSQAQALTDEAAARARNLGSQASERARNLGAQAAGAAQSVRERIPFIQPEEALALHFRAWAANATAGEAELAGWLASLNESQFADFTETVRDFCASIGVNLALLVEDGLKPMPELEEKATAAVVNYCRSCQQAAAAQTELELFRAYREYTQKSGSRKGRAYGEKLLDRLLEAGLTTVSLSDFLGATPKAKDAQTLQAIQSAAEKDPAAFSRVLKSLEADAEAASATAAPVAAAA